MIPELEYTDKDRHFRLRGIRLRDEFALAEIMSDRADDGTGPYTTAFSKAHCRWWWKWNAEFDGLPTDAPRTLSWMLDMDGETVAMCRVGFWFRHADIIYNAVHPDYRGQGIMTVMQLMLRTLIEPLGIESISFDSLASAPQVKAHAEQRLELTPDHSRVGLTQQEVTHYRFTLEHHRKRIERPEHAAEKIKVKHGPNS